MVFKSPVALAKGLKMLQSGSSEQEARSYMESQGLRNIQISKPSLVDVSAEGMAKKYSRGSIRTSYSSSGLLTGSRLKKKTLLGE